MEFIQTVQVDPEVHLKLSLKELELLIGNLDADYSPATDSLWNDLCHVRNEVICELDSYHRSLQEAKVPTFGDLVKNHDKEVVRKNVRAHFEAAMADGLPDEE